MIRFFCAPFAVVALIGAQNTAPVKMTMPPSVHPPQLAVVDHDFAIAATQGNAGEIAAANLALAHTQSDDVKAFARQMLTDHGSIGMEGKPVIAPHLHVAPIALAPGESLALKYLASLAPVDFDQQYAMLQIGDHLATATAFATEARDGKDPALKAFAKKWLPTIQAHLQLAVALVKHVGGDTPFRN